MYSVIGIHVSVHICVFIWAPNTFWAPGGVRMSVKSHNLFLVFPWGSKFGYKNVV